MLNQLTVFCWHNIEPTAAYPAGSRSVAGFEAQVRFLARWGSIVRLGDAIESLRQGRPLPPRPVALTFDDGYQDTLEVAGPILARHGASATIFLTTGFLDGTSLPWWELLAWAIRDRTVDRLEWDGRAVTVDSDTTTMIEEGLKPLGHGARVDAVEGIVNQLAPRGECPVESIFMSWDEATRLESAGFEVGSHTTEHAILARESADYQRETLRAARDRIRAQLGVDVAGLAYPNGGRSDFDDVTRRAADEVGHDWAVTTMAGLNGVSTDPFALRRVVVRPERGVPGLFQKVVTGPVRAGVAAASRHRRSAV
ncbi:MAG: polysaccharide deacetylase family protein [Actinomycetia bacterium]|nr:polysaccharide deacetylase family protein [Actinomycetes bacterium]